MEISVIIPYRDKRKTLAEAIESVVRQDFHSHELIVHQGEYNIGKNINDAVTKAEGKYIKILADDDLLTENCLKDLWHKAEEGYDLVCANAINFEEDGSEHLVKSFIPRRVMDLALENKIHGGTCLYRRSTMPQWDELLWTAEEYELHLRMAASRLRFGYIDKIVYRYRLHQNQKSGFYWQQDPDKKLYRYEYIENLQNRYMLDMPIMR